MLLPVIFVGLIGSLVNLRESAGDHQRLYSASLLVLVTVALFLVALYARSFALRAQDRAIRAEENLRHFVLTGKLLDARLSMRQIIGLRFASDDEFVALAQKAAAAGMVAKGHQEGHHAVEGRRRPRLTATGLGRRIPLTPPRR